MTARKTKKRLGEYLIDKGLITHEQLNIASKEKAITQALLGDIVVKFGFCTREDVIKTMIEFCPNDLIGNSVTNIGWPLRFLLDTQSVDKGNTGALFYIATLHKNPEWVRAEAEKYLNAHNKTNEHLKVKLAACDVLEIKKFMAENRNNSLSALESNKPYEVEQEDDVNKILESLVTEAMEKRATDIHIIQTEETVHVKLRIDGLMHIAHILNKEAANKLYPRIKGKAAMDISQTRTSQDGSFSLPFKGRILDFRVAVKPIKDGEKITIRILDKEDPNVNKDIDNIGLTPFVLEQWKAIVKKRNGLVLVTGATGSGKTTTLYSTIRYMDYLHKSISTIEDPIEYTLSFIAQTQVNRMVTPPVDFDTFVRNELRHDPDIIIVGEMRDTETVNAAMHLADTGHLVYGTLHTNDIPTTFSRLQKLGVDMHQLAFSLRGILVQKLARVICTKCNGLADEEENPCSHCNNTGYYGQTLIAEFAPINNMEEFNAIWNGTREYHTFAEDAVIKAKQGITDCKELSRVLGEKVTYCNEDSCVRGGARCI